MICTTLNKIRAHHPCRDGWERLLKPLGRTKADDEPLPLVTVLDINGFGDCVWCLRTVPEHDREWRLFAVWCARKVEHLMTDGRSREVLNIAERFANGLATADELAAARSAAWDAARSAAWSAAWAAAWAAARSAERVAAWDAAWDAARSAALDAARSAERDAAWAAARSAERVAAWAAAWDAAWAAARKDQETELRRILNE